MARIPQEQIDWIKQDVSLAGLAECQGIDLKRHGADLIGLCPFHDDKNPSLVISPEKNLWHCLGACQTGGSVIDWVMKRDRVSFRHAVELLRREGPGVVPAESAVNRVRSFPVPFDKLYSYYGKTATYRICWCSVSHHLAR